MTAPLTTHERVPVSVVIPAYNRAEMVQRAVRSVTAQRRYTPAQVIVVDDCSTDQTGAAARDAGAEVVRTPQNLGEGGARNAGIAAADQPWVALLDSDDEWLPHLLETLWPLRADHLLVAGSCLWRAGDAQRDGFAGVAGRKQRVLNTPTALLYPENFVTASGAMARRDAMLSVGGYDTGLKWGADLDLWVRLLERGTAIATPVPVSIYHVHPGQVTSDRSATRMARLELMRSYADRSWMSGRVSALATGVIAWETLRTAIGERQPGAAGLSLKWLASDPRSILGIFGIVARRWRLRRRSSQFGRDGVPTSVELSPGKKGLFELLTLARRPVGQAVFRSRSQRVLLKILGVEPLSPEGRPDQSVSGSV